MSGISFAPTQLNIANVYDPNSQITSATIGTQTAALGAAAIGAYVTGSVVVPYSTNYTFGMSIPGANFTPQGPDAVAQSGTWMFLGAQNNNTTGNETITNVTCRRIL